MSNTPLQKPKLGSPCNHCGICCELSLCFVAQIQFPSRKGEGPCPNLHRADDGRKLCSLAMGESHTRLPQMIAAGLGMGVGCSMVDDDTTAFEKKVYSKKHLAYYRAKFPATCTEKAPDVIVLPERASMLTDDATYAGA